MVSGASVTPGVVSLPVHSACVSTHVTRGEMRSTLHNVHRAQVALLSLGEYETDANSRCDPRRISCRKLFWRGPIGEFTPRWAHRSPKDDGDTRRESLAIDARTWPSSREEKIRLDIATNCMIGVMFDTAARRKCNVVHASIARSIGVTDGLGCLKI